MELKITKEKHSQRFHQKATTTTMSSIQKPRKRKNQLDLQQRTNNKKPTSQKPKLTLALSDDPYPDHPWPSPDQCRAVRDDLLALHGFPKEFAKYRRTRPTNGSDGVKSEAFDSGDETEDKESVLDGLVKTVLSQNTTEVNSQRAFASLKSAFPTWQNVLDSDSKTLEEAIRCGGLAPTKARCIKNTLTCLLERKGKLCFEYLRGFSVEEVKAELSKFKGIGPKTVACVLMFQLQRDDFPVDTHVFEISKSLGWLPSVADRNKAYLHLNNRIPDELKFDLNCLIYTHGKICRKCVKKTGNRTRKEDSDCEPCPLLLHCEGS